MRRLRDSIKFRLVYADETRFGSTVSGRIDETVRTLCREIVAAREQVGLAQLIARSHALLSRACEGELGQCYLNPDTLREECLYPAPAATTVSGLVIEDARVELGTLQLPRTLIPELARWLGQWQRASDRPRSAAAASLWDALLSLDALTDEPAGQPRLPGDALVAGHAMVRVGTAGHDVLLDPFIRPTAASYPTDYQPPTADALAPAAICISHSHPDHFDPGSLLRFGADTPIYVPYVPRESILAIDMEARLRELGFTDVRVLRWYDEARVGDTRVVALPFYGEQPTTSEQLHPEARNHGNAYLIEHGATRVAFTVDGGADRDGSTYSLAARARARHGAIDALFAGYRAWALYPLRYLFTSVARYLLLVPRELWGVRQKIMDDADGALDVAERWGAAHLVPYADGGAPWYWDIGLGPQLDRASARRGGDLHFDPRPEHVGHVAARRSSAAEGEVASPVRVMIARPRDALEIDAGALAIRRDPQRGWPYGEPA